MKRSQLIFKLLQQSSRGGVTHAKIVPARNFAISSLTLDKSKVRTHFLGLKVTFGYKGFKVTRHSYWILIKIVFLVIKFMSNLSELCHCR